MLVAEGGVPGGFAVADPHEPPLVLEDGGLRWVRTDIARGPDLVDGAAWVEEFGRRVAAAAREAAPPRRLLRQVATDGDAPHFWAKAGGTGSVPFALRNEVLRQMDAGLGSADGSRGAGRKVRLATGEEVIFWFNVGPPGALRDRVYVTAARCPHQGVCLNTGELMDVEEISGAGGRRGMVRCPRHNKIFDLKTGESPGNAERLPVYPCRFEHGRWYVAVGPAQCLDIDQQGPAECEDVDMEVEEPLPKRNRPDDAEPVAVEPAGASASALANTARPFLSRSSTLS